MFVKLDQTDSSTEETMSSCLMKCESVVLKMLSNVEMETCISELVEVSTISSENLQEL